ncbi:MAG TPA: hypothetical protein VFN06_06305, partial [Gaiellaceae bacterium]|nr:hypothetical protein [Gaiellaceae bacterium]
LAPELEPYFVTSRHDDDLGILQSSIARSEWPPRIQAFVAVPGVVAVIDSVVAGAMVAIAAIGLELSTASTLTLGAAAFLVSLGLFFVWGRRQIARGLASLEPRFPGAHTTTELAGR